MIPSLPEFDASCVTYLMQTDKGSELLTRDEFLFITTKPHFGHLDTIS
jgi:hypothetical protein